MSINESIAWPETWQNGILKTLNNMGIMTLELAPSSQSFVNYSKLAEAPILDIGCAFGSATIPALMNGAEVVACDLDKNHLEFIKNNINITYQKNLSTLCGNFLDCLKFPECCFSAIHISMVLHFLKGFEVQKALQLFSSLLKKEGRLFIVNMTSSLGIYDQVKLKQQISLQKKNGTEWYGEIEQKKYIREEYIHQVPELAHFIDEETIVKLLSENGFRINKLEYFRYQNIPEFYKTNGKEYISIEATKL